jgi:glycine reductase complex component B subunit gamma
MPKMRIMHYLNQFFAGLGAEDRADTEVGSKEGPAGPGKRLQTLLGDAAEIVVTAYCGDNYFNDHVDEALSSILQVARDRHVNLLVAGPAFASGRYGFACVEVCHALSTSLDMDCVTGMHQENPGIEVYRGYKDRRVFAFPTTEIVSRMEEALVRMAQFVVKLSSGARIGSPSDEGYIARGFRVVEVEKESGGSRAVKMLLDKLACRPFSTEVPVEALERVPVAPRVKDLAHATLGLVTTSGIHLPGNPDGLRGYQNDTWAKYFIGNLNSMQEADWEVTHGGYNTEFMKKNPNFGVPLDACRSLEREGVFARIHPYFYVTPGSRGLISAMERMGKEMCLDMKAHGVDAALVVSN